MQEAYACTKTVQVPYQVKDIDVKANVKAIMAQLPAGVTVTEKLNLSLAEDKFGFNLGDATGKLDNKTIWFLEKTITENTVGSLKTIDAILKLAALPVDVFSTLIKNKLVLKLTAEVLSFDTAEAKYPEMYKVSFDFLSGKLGSGTEIHLTKAITLDKLPHVTQNARTVVNVELKDLGLVPGTRKPGAYQITVTLEGVVDAKKVVNSVAIPKVLKTTGLLNTKIN